MYLLKFLIVLGCFLVLIISGTIYTASLTTFEDAVLWVQNNWIITALAAVGVIAIIWSIRKLLKGLIVIAGLSLFGYYALTYGPPIIEFLKPFGFFNLAFLLLLLPLFSERVRDLLWDWNFELEYRADKKNKKQNRTSNSTDKSAYNTTFEIYVKKMDHQKIQHIAMAKYNEFANKYGNIGFGESGANEFVAAALLSEYRPVFKKNINEGIENVFNRQYSPLQFSDYMDGVVNSSDIGYSNWSAVYNYLKENVKWIKNHEVSGDQATISPVVSEALVGSVFKEKSQPKVQSYLTYVKELDHQKIQHIAIAKYNEFAKKYGNIGFGESGANEFVAAALFAEYRPAFKKYINEGIENVFKRQYSPLQFSDYMDDIVNRSDIGYSNWSAVYNYLKDNVHWIKNHEVSGEQAKISPKVSEAIVNSVAKEKPKPTVQNFLTYVKELDHRKIQHIAIAKYNEFAKKYGNIGFGESGANEFVAAALFAEYRPAFKKYINEGVESVFKRKYSSSQFSDYIIGIVNRSDIGSANWNAVVEYAKNDIQWIKNHEVSAGQVMKSSESKVKQVVPSTYMNQPGKNIYQVVGVTYDNRQAVIKKLQKGDVLFLVLEPTNPHDKHAIHVIDKFNQSVGYISKAENQKLAQYFKGKPSLRASVDEIYFGSDRASYYGVQLKIDNQNQSQHTNFNSPLYSTNEYTDDENYGSLDWDDFNEDGVPYSDLMDDDEREFYNKRYH